MTMRHSLVTVLGLLLLSGLAACRGLPEGPTLSDVVITNIQKVPTTPNAGLCCCRITANVVNNNAVPVHATIKYSAYDGVDPDAVATILQFVPDLGPGNLRSVEAAGLIVPCNAIRDLQTEVDVRGITFPPR